MNMLVRVYREAERSRVSRVAPLFQCGVCKQLYNGEADAIRCRLKHLTGDRARNWLCGVCPIGVPGGIGNDLLLPVDNPANTEKDASVNADYQCQVYRCNICAEIWSLTVQEGQATRWTSWGKEPIRVIRL